MRVAATHGVEDDVDLTGYVPNPLPYMRECAVFALSSRFEGYSLVLAEALAAGCKVVSTDCESGPREVLRSGQFGRLVPVGSVNKLADALDSALDARHDPSPQQEWIRRLSFDKVIDRYEQLLCPPSRSQSTEVEPAGRLVLGEA